MINIYHIFLLMFVNSFMICGLFVAANHKDGKGRGLILKPLKDLSERLLGTYWSKPLFGCYKCMASLWGIPVYTLAIFEFHLNLEPLAWLGLIMYVPALSFLSTLFYSTYESLLPPSDPNRCDHKPKCISPQEQILQGIRSEEQLSA